MINICKFCKIQFEARKSDINRNRAIFCSTSCAAKYGNSLRKSSKTLVQCATCGKDLHRDKRRIKKCKHFFCNRECKTGFEKTGIQNMKRCGAVRHAHLNQKDVLLSQFGIKCQYSDCSNDLMNNRRMVDMHHFDGPLDHHKTVLLCPYHHRLADLDLINVSSIQTYLSADAVRDTTSSKEIVGS